MSAKSKMLDTRMIIYLLIILVIIGAAYIVLTAPAPEDTPDTLEVYFPNEVLQNQASRVGQRFIIEGYYNPTINEGSIVGTQNDALVGVNLDSSNLVNTTSPDLPLETGTKYQFTGVLEQRGTPPFTDYVFNAELVDEV